jgi:hypothetical protein
MASATDPRLDSPYKNAPFGWRFPRAKLQCLQAGTSESSVPPLLHGTR